MLGAESCCRPFALCGTGCDEIPQPTGDLQIENVSSVLRREVTAEGDWAEAILNLLLKQLWAGTCAITVAHSPLLELN